MLVDGIKFYKGKDGYYMSGRKETLKRLHIYIWEKHNSTVPKGYCIHHIDHNKDNNDINNLKLMSISEHSRYHINLMDKDKMRENLEINARPKAIEWHGSEKGKKWHKKHYEEMKDKLYAKVIKKCQYCGKEYETVDSPKNKYCSNKCKSAARRESGKDDVERKCERCGKYFTVNKYSPKRFCSNICRKEARDENKKHKKD